MGHHLSCPTRRCRCHRLQTHDLAREILRRPNRRITAVIFGRLSMIWEPREPKIQR